MELRGRRSWSQRVTSWCLSLCGPSFAASSGLALPGCTNESPKLNLFSSNLVLLCVCLYFPVAMVRNFDKSRFREQGLFRFTYQGEPLGVGKLRWQGLVAAGHIEPSQEADVNEQWLLPNALLHSYSPGPQPRNSTTHRAWVFPPQLMQSGSCPKDVHRILSPR